MASNADWAYSYDFGKAGELYVKPWLELEAKRNDCVLKDWTGYKKPIDYLFSSTTGQTLSKIEVKRVGGSSAARSPALPFELVTNAGNRGWPYDVSKAIFIFDGPSGLSVYEVNLRKLRRQTGDFEADATASIQSTRGREGRYNKVKYIPLELLAQYDCLRDIGREVEAAYISQHGTKPPEQLFEPHKHRDSRPMELLARPVSPAHCGA